MTNEPPTGDGEELVEADLPGWSDPSTAGQSAEQPRGPDADAAERSRADVNLGFDRSDGRVDATGWRNFWARALGNEQEWARRIDADAAFAWMARRDGEGDPDWSALSGEDQWRSWLEHSQGRAQGPKYEEDPEDSVLGEIDFPIDKAAAAFTTPDLEADDSTDATGTTTAPSPTGAAAVGGPAIGGSLLNSPRVVVGLVVAIGIVIVVAAVSLGGSEEPGDAVAASDGAVASTPASAGAAVPVTSDPGEGYTFCQVHPDEDAESCLPHYASTGIKSTLFPASPRRVLEHTITFGAPIPTNPELPLEYKLVISGAAGPTIEQILSGGPGEPLSCVRLVNGAPTADGPEDVCGQVTAPDTIYMQTDLAAYGEGPIKAEWFTQEIEADGTVRGDYKDLLGDSGILMR